MIHNNLISSASIIAKIIADLNLNEDDLRISDVKEYIMEAVLKIGAIQQYEHKISIIPVVNHQAKLPCDLYKLGQVAFSNSNDGCWLPMRKTTSSFSVVHDRCHGKPCMLIQDSALIPLVKNLYNLVDDKEALEKLNGNINMKQTLSALLNDYTFINHKGKATYQHIDGTMFSFDLQYDTKPGYIYTNIPRGFVKISYYSIPVDEDSMPLIPDLESYKEAIFYYVTMKLLYPKYLKGQISQNVYYDVKRSWNYYCKQAYGDAMMPGVDELESIKNTYNKLYVEFDDHDTFFSTTGEEQILYNQNRL